MKNTFLPSAYLRGKIIPFEDANVSVATHALHYGTAAFAGMRVLPNDKAKSEVLLFRPELHFKRLESSAKMLGFSISQKDIERGVTKFLAANPGEKPYYLRPLVYASDLGVAPRLHNLESDLLIYGIEMGTYLSKNGITCCFSSWVRGEDRSLPLRGKISGTYVTSALAKTEAVERGFDEAIFLNSQGKVAEGSAMNIFLVKDGTLITPNITQDILEGITRRSIIEIAQALNMNVEEREVDKSELLIADEVFLSGTAAQIAPITKIEQYQLPTENPITKQISDEMNKILRQEGIFDWLKSYKAL